MLSQSTRPCCGTCVHAPAWLCNMRLPAGDTTTWALTCACSRARGSCGRRWPCRPHCLPRRVPMTSSCARPTPIATSSASGSLEASRPSTTLSRVRSCLLPLHACVLVHPAISGLCLHSPRTCCVHWVLERVFCNSHRGLFLSVCTSGTFGMCALYHVHQRLTWHVTSCRRAVRAAYDLWAERAVPAPCSARCRQARRACGCAGACCSDIAPNP